MLFPTLVKVLHLTSATTPALVSNAYNVDPTYGTAGTGCGAPGMWQVFPVQVIRAQASSMTGVSFKIETCRDPLVPVWVTVLARLRGASATTLAQTNTLAASAGTTAEDALICTDCLGAGAVRITAEAIGANAGAGDSASAWAWV